MKKFVLALFILFPVNSFAGAWVNAPGEGTVIHNLYYWQFNVFKNRNGVTSDTPDFSKIEYKPYIEYGVADGYSVGISPSFQHLNEEQALPAVGDDKNDALASVDVFLKRRLYENKEWQFSTAIIPMIELPGIYEESESPFFGKQEQFWNLSLSAGINTYNIENNYGYVNLETGYRSRFTDSFTGEGGGAIKTELVASFPVSNGHSIIGSINNTKTVSGYTTGATSFLEKYGYDSTQLGITDSYLFLNGKMKFEYGYTYQLDARNTGIGNGYKISLSHKF